jgi:hypothetical protein
MLINLGIVQDSDRQFKNYVSLFGSSVSTSVNSLATTKDATYVSSTSSSKARIISILPNGELKWQKTIDSSTSTTISSLSVDSSKNLIMTGSFNDGTERPGLVTKLSPAGDVIWQTSHFLTSGTGSSWSTSAVDSQDNIYVSGLHGSSSFVLAKYSSSGVLQWARSLETGINTQKICVDSSDNIWMVAIKSGADVRLILAKYSSSGTLLLQKNIVIIPTISSTAITITPDTSNNIYISFNTSFSTMTNYFIKIDQNAGIVWQKGFSLSQTELFYDSSISQDGSIYYSGGENLGSANAGSVLKISQDGAVLWKRSFTPAELQLSYVKVDNLGNIIFAQRSLKSGVRNANIWSLPENGTKTGTYTLDSIDFAYQTSTNPTLFNSTFSVANTAFSEGALTFLGYNPLPSVLAGSHTYSTIQI